MIPSITPENKDQTNAAPQVLQSGKPVKTAESPPPDTTPLQNKAMDAMEASQNNTVKAIPGVPQQQTPEYVPMPKPTTPSPLVGTTHLTPDIKPQKITSDTQSENYDLQIASLGKVGGGNLPWSPSLSNAIPQVGPFQQFTSAFTENAIGGSTREASYLLWDAYHKIVDDSIPLTPDQRKQLQQDHPDFDYPHGVDNKEAKFLTEMQTTELRNNFLNSQADTFWQKSFSELGAITGTFARPVPLAAGVLGAYFFAPEEAGLIAAGATSTAYRLAAYKSAPIVFSATAQTAEEMADAGYDYNMGKKYDSVGGLLNLSLATTMGTAFSVLDIAYDPKAKNLLGNAIRSKIDDPNYLKRLLDVSDYNMESKFPKASYSFPLRQKEEHTPESAAKTVDDIIGSAKMMSQDDDATLHKIAVSQMLSGKDINLDVPIKKAIYEEGKALRNRFVDAGINPSVIADTIEETQGNLEQEIRSTASDLDLSNIKLSAPQSEVDIANIQAEQEHLNRQMELLMSTKGVYERGKISTDREGTARVAKRFEDLGLDSKAVSDLTQNEPQLLYKNIGDIGKKIKRNEILQGVHDTLENLQKENKSIRDKLDTLYDAYGFHEFLKTALRDELLDVTPDEIKSHIRYTSGADIQDDILGDNRPTIKNISETQNKILGDLKKEIDDTDLNNMKSKEKGAEEHNKEIDEATEEIKKSDRRISKLPKLVQSAINCLRNI